MTTQKHGMPVDVGGYRLTLTRNGWRRDPREKHRYGPAAELLRILNDRDGRFHPCNTPTHEERPLDLVAERAVAEFGGVPPCRARLEEELDEAERRAWVALSGYKFQMFGYWAAIWVHLNRVGEFNRPNPFSHLVKAARLRRHNPDQFNDYMAPLKEIT